MRRIAASLGLADEFDHERPAHAAGSGSHGRGHNGAGRPSRNGSRGGGGRNRRRRRRAAA
jgi:hypothetical protein